MCRMIAAAGRVDSARLHEVLVRMASNENPDHVHEVRSRGVAHSHEDGWGAVWSAGGRLDRLRSPLSLLSDPSAREIDSIRTDLLVLHARRMSPRSRSRLENTHPFLTRLDGVEWAFCHNGAIEDQSPLRGIEGVRPAGGTDSEKLFHHILSTLSDDRRAPAGGGLGSAQSDEAIARGILAALVPIRDFTSLHSFLVRPGRVFAAAARHPEKSRPEYHALWEGRGEDLHVVSSETTTLLGALEWRRLPEPGIVILRGATA